MRISANTSATVRPKVNVKQLYVAARTVTHHSTTLVSATVHVAATLSLGAAARVTATPGVGAAVGVVGGVGVLQRRRD